MEEKQLTQDVQPVIVQSTQLQVATKDDYYNASEFLKDIKSAQKKVVEFFEDMKANTYKAWKEICNKEKSFLDPLSGAERLVKGKMLEWKLEEDRKAEEERIKLQKEVEAKAEREREKLLKKSENMKTESKQEEYMERAENVVTPIIEVQSKAEKVKGVSVSTTYEFEIVDKKEFVKAATNDDNLLGFIEINLSGLNKIAKATKGNVNYPGLKVNEKKLMSTRI